MMVSSNATFVGQNITMSSLNSLIRMPKKLWENAAEV